MAGVRRSVRIPKEVPIVLLGTDTSGRIFSEETRTLVLSRRGAGIHSRNKFSPDEVLTLRIADTSLGKTRSVTSTASLSPTPISTSGRWNFRHRLNGISLRLKLRSNVAIAAPVRSFSRTRSKPTSFSPATLFFAFANPAVRPLLASRPLATFSNPLRFVPCPCFAATASSVFRSRFTVRTVCLRLFFIIHTRRIRIRSRRSRRSQAVGPDAPTRSLTAAEPPAFAGGGKKNRRCHVRTRVGFTACVRLDAATEELVKCDNISKGGPCSRSRKHCRKTPPFKSPFRSLPVSRPSSSKGKSAAPKNSLAPTSSVTASQIPDRFFCFFIVFTDEGILTTQDLQLRTNPSFKPAESPENTAHPESSDDASHVPQSHMPSHAL